jgi:hypothetical protein
MQGVEKNGFQTIIKQKKIITTYPYNKHPYTSSLACILAKLIGHEKINQHNSRKEGEQNNAQPPTHNVNCYCFIPKKPPHLSHDHAQRPPRQTIDFRVLIFFLA